MQNQIKSLIKNTIGEYFNKLQQKNRKVSNKPTEIHISVTENCCLQCKMCDIWKIKEKQKPLDYITGKKIIDILTNWLGTFNLTFAGGEPFLNKDIFKIIKYASDRQITTSTNSNGFIINKNKAKSICDSGLSTIFFSIDGLRKKHDFIRGRKDAFKKVIQAIRNIQNNKTDKKPKIYINTVISDNNLHLLTKLIDLARELNVRGINFQTLMPNFASKYTDNWWINNPFWPRDKEKIHINIKKIIEYKRRFGNYILNTQENINKFEEYFLKPDEFQRNEKCFVGLNNLMIDTNGNLRLCYEMDPIGNIFDRNPNKIWKGRKAAIIRKNILKCQKPCKLLPCNYSHFENILKRSLNKVCKFIKIFRFN